MSPTKPPLDPKTPSPKPPTSNNPSSNNLDTPVVKAKHVSMPFKNDRSPKFNVAHFRARLPFVQEASRRLQNALDIRNEDFWPTPSMPGSSIDSITYEVNAEALGQALAECRKFQVAMDRSTERGELLDGTITGLKTRKVKEKIKIKQDDETSGLPEGRTGEPTTPQSEADKENMSPTEKVAQDFPQFPDPQNMAGSFTDAICQYEHFNVKPVLTLTLIDTTPSMVNPAAERSILLKHFEVGLDGVESIVAGEVKIPESPVWTKFVREDRLGKLGTLKNGRGGYSAELEAHQRRCRHGEGRWMFYGIKFKQSHEELKMGQGKWACFGAPLEAIQRFEAIEENIALGGGDEESQVPAHFERFLRTKSKFSLGGVPCMDLWEDGEKWDDGVWMDVRRAMANTGLVLNTLYQTKEQKDAATTSCSAAQSCKRKRI